MKTINSERKFNEYILAEVSTEARQSFEAFSDAIPYAEELVRKYTLEKNAIFTGTHTNALSKIQEDSRLVFAMSWTKAVVLSRGIVDEINANNLLVAFQALRGYVEVAATTRYVFVRLLPIVEECAKTGEVSFENARKISAHLHALLHGGRFDWATYFQEGAAAILDKKKLKRTKAQKDEYEASSIRIGTCIKEWSEEEPAVEFIYDYLCDLVHPNKGSNLILLGEIGGQAAFDSDGRSKMGMHILECIFPYAASLCMRSMNKYQMLFAQLGAVDQN